jgi:hypothetical protein
MPALFRLGCFTGLVLLAITLIAADMHPLNILSPRHWRDCFLFLCLTSCLDVLSTIIAVRLYKYSWTNEENNLIHYLAQLGGYNWALVIHLCGLLGAILLVYFILKILGTKYLFWAANLCTVSLAILRFGAAFNNLLLPLIFPSVPAK